MWGIGRVTSPALPVPHVLRTGLEDWTMPQKIAIGDGTYYANYKEPFAQLEGAQPGYPYGELPYDGASKLLCPYCSAPQRTFHNVGAHIAKRHGMTADLFKAEAGLNQGTALVSEQTRTKNSIAATRRQFGQTFGNHDAERLAAAGRIGAPKGGHGRRTPQALNARGCCFDQVLAVARRIQLEKGHITQTLMRKEGISERIIEMHFGSWEAFFKNPRINENTQRSGVHRRDDDLLRDLRSMAEFLGHTPTVSDQRRYQMAGRKAYETHFGSWVKACELAGIQPNVPAVWASRPYTSEEEAAVLSAYATRGSYHKAAERAGISASRARDILLRFGITPLNGNEANQAQRQEQMANAAEMARRLTGWPKQAVA